MESAESSAQSFLHARDNDLREEPGRLCDDDTPMSNRPTNDSGAFNDVSPLHANEERDSSERINHDSPLPAINGPLAQPLLHNYSTDMDEGPQHSHQSISLLDDEVQATMRQDPGETRKTNLGQRGAQSEKHFLKTLPRIGLEWDRFSWFKACMWAKGWMAETCSYIVAILALTGLVVTLSAHHSRPLPQWPQLVTINSIISLFSLLMRACVGVVIAEGRPSSTVPRDLC
jgi:hypothetical protein